MHVISPPAVRRILPWALFLLAFYLLSGFLSLIILTFILSFTMNALCTWMQGMFQFKFRTLLTINYVILICVMVIVGVGFAPELNREWKIFRDKVVDWQKIQMPKIKTYIADYDIQNAYATATEYVQTALNTTLPYVTDFLKSTGKFLLHVILSIIFSYVVLWDLDYFRLALPRLRNTRIDFIYDEVAPHLVRYFAIMGKVFKAQILVATLNAAITLVGIVAFGIPHRALLTLFVWVMGLIPVLGVVISSVPIALICLVEGGPYLMLKSILLVILIHMLEAYVLNPRIQGEVLKVHPVFMLLIIFLGEHFGGVYGIFLGIPLVIYFFQDLIQKPAAPAPAALLEVPHAKLPPG